MVVSMVTLYMRVTMRRPTAYSAFFTAFKASSAGLIALTVIVACGEYGTSVMPRPDNITRVQVATVDYVMPDSVKLGLVSAGAATKMLPIGLSADVRTAPLGSSSTVANACGGGGFAGYTERRLSADEFTAEAAPTFAPSSALSDDGLIQDLPIGFDFSFYGTTYNKVNIYSNGFLMFGTAPPLRQSGSAVGGFIPQNLNPKNIIALSWSDWSPQLVANGILFETRGTAPNRKFIVQYNNVPEYHSTGRLMAQVILSEGSNDVTIYTNSLTIGNSSHFVTQGIEDLTGTQALYDSVQNGAGTWTMRVHNVFSLTNDAIRFSLISTKDDIAPSITAPENLTRPNDPGLASAVVVVAPPAATDNCSAVTFAGVRSDSKPLDAPYPVGVTTITWTATDASENSSTVKQSVTVVDLEPPTLEASDIIVPATTRNGALVTYQLVSHDNVGVTSVVCDPVSGSLFAIGERSVSCTAYDAAGNGSVPATFSVLVLNAQAQMENLIQYILRLGMPDGTTNPLVNQLRAAYSDGNSCKKMSDFISMVSKKGRDIPIGSGPYMTNEASRIMVVMSCSGAPAHARLFNPALLGN